MLECRIIAANSWNADT